MCVNISLVQRVAWLALLLAGLAHPASGQIVMYGLPMPVTAQEVDALIEQLGMDQTQADAVRAMHARYWENWQASFGESGPEWRRLRTRLNNFSRDMKQPDGRSAVELLDEFKSQEKALRPSMLAMTSSLWDEIRSVVAEPQHPEILRAIATHERDEQRRGLVAYRERTVDLRDLLEPAMKDSRAALGQRQVHDIAADTPRFSEPELVAVDRVLAQYEIERASRLKALMRGQEEVATNLAEAADMYRAAYEQQRRPEATAAEITPLFEKAQATQAIGMEHVLRPSANLVQLNRATLTQLRDALQPSSMRIVELMYFSAAYPEVYPDPASAEALYRAADGIASLDINQRAAVAALHADFLRSHDQLSREMMESVFARGQVTTRGGPRLRA